MASLVTLSASAAGHARGEEPLIAVEGERAGCIEQIGLRERVKHYFGAHAASDVRVVVRIAAPATEFELLRGTALLARRRFEHLPVSCPERRDTLALAIAVALAHVAPRETSATSSELPPPALATDAAIGGGTARGEAESASPPATMGLVPASQAAATAESPAVAAPEPQAKLVAYADSTVRSASDEVRSESAAVDDAEASADEVRSESAAVDDAEGADGAIDDARDADTPEHSLFAGGRYTVAVLPEPVVVFAGGADIGLVPFLSLQVAGFASLPETSTASGATVRAQAFGSELLACLRTQLAVFAAGGCGGLAAASVASQGDGYFRDQHTQLFWLAGLVRMALRWPAQAPLAVQLVAGAHASLVRPRMEVRRSSEPDLMASVVGGSLGAELVVVLP